MVSHIESQWWLLCRAVDWNRNLVFKQNACIVRPKCNKWVETCNAPRRQVPGHRVVRRQVRHPGGQARLRGRRQDRVASEDRVGSE